MAISALFVIPQIAKSPESPQQMTRMFGAYKQNKLDHHFNLNEANQERQILHVFSHRWNLSLDR